MQKYQCRQCLQNKGFEIFQNTDDYRMVEHLVDSAQIRKIRNKFCEFSQDQSLFRHAESKVGRAILNGLVHASTNRML